MVPKIVAKFGSEFKVIILIDLCNLFSWVILSPFACCLHRHSVGFVGLVVWSGGIFMQFLACVLGEDTNITAPLSWGTRQWYYTSEFFARGKQ